MTHDTKFAALESTLRGTREALLQGRIDTVAGQAEGLEAAAQQIEGLALTNAQAQVLRSEAGALEVLLRAAIEGISAAHRRIDALRAAHGGLDSYDRRGRAQRIVSASSKPARRV